jgi:hypothetical protein
MGSGPTLTPHAPPGHDPTRDPATQAAEDAFAQLNPALAAFVDHPDPVARRSLLRSAEDIDAGGNRAWVEQATENAPTRAEVRHAVVRHRAETAQQRATDRARVHAEEAFDRLNPEFGVPADTRDPLGHQAVRDREAGLSLGTRAAVAGERPRPGPVHPGGGLPRRRHRPHDPPAPRAPAGRPRAMTPTVTTAAGRR